MHLWCFIDIQRFSLIVHQFWLAHVWLFIDFHRLFIDLGCRTFDVSLLLIEFSSISVGVPLIVNQFSLRFHRFWLVYLRHFHRFLSIVIVFSWIMVGVPFILSGFHCFFIHVGWRTFDFSSSLNSLVFSSFVVGVSAMVHWFSLFFYRFGLAYFCLLLVFIVSLSILVGVPLMSIAFYFHRILLAYLWFFIDSAIVAFSSNPCILEIDFWFIDIWWASRASS